LISYRNVLLIITRHNELAKAIYATETARSNPSSIDASCSWTGLLVQMACLMTCSNLNNKRLPAINGITCTPSMGGWSIDGLKRVRWRRNGRMIYFSANILYICTATSNNYVQSLKKWLQWIDEDENPSIQLAQPNGFWSFSQVIFVLKKLKHRKRGEPEKGESNRREGHAVLDA
jgi:hypothetical protein